jgi:hypothetical protein
MHSIQADALKWFYANMDRRIDSLTNCVAMIVRGVPGQRIESFGSGFFYSKDGWPFFITAKHVLDEVETSIHRYRGAFVLVRGQKEVISMSGMEFFSFPEWDIAISPLWKLPSDSYAHAEFLQVSDIAYQIDSSNFFAFTGYPSARNKTYTGREVKMQQRAITLPVPEFLELRNVTSPFIYFELTEENLHDSDLNKVSMPFPEGLHGMSGGPVFQISGTPDMQILKLLGVGISWRKDKQLKAVRFDAIDFLLSQHLSW